MIEATGNNRKKIGLALGGGYARGLAHIGVLEVLEREGIPIDLIAGTSIGSLVGALYAREKDASLLKKQACQMDVVGMTSLLDFTLPKSGFLGGKKVTNLLRHLIGDVEFKDLDIPLACVATDINSGDEVVIDDGKVLEAVRASISIPVIFSVVKRKGKYLVDGGLANQVPVSVVKSMGADFVIAVDITPRKHERAKYLAHNREESREPGIFQVVIQTIYLGTYSTVQLGLDKADVIIHPDLSHIGPAEFNRAGECILGGELAAVDLIPALKRQLADAGIGV